MVSAYSILKDYKVTYQFIQHDLIFNKYEIYTKTFGGHPEC